MTTKQWWHDPKYWFKSPVDAIEEPDLTQIIAEAGRLGEVKAWEEARNLVSTILVRYTGEAGISDYEFITRVEAMKAFETKLAALNNPAPSKEE